CCPFYLLSVSGPTRERHSVAVPFRHALTGADSCRRTARDLIAREDRAPSERNRCGSQEMESVSAAFGRATESATEHARLLRTSFLSRRDDARRGCRRGRSCAPRWCSQLSRTVPNNQESRQCSDRLT